MSESNIATAVNVKEFNTMGRIHKILMEYAVIFIVFLAAIFFTPDDKAAFGPIAAVPSIFLLFFIFYTKRILEGLTLASLLGFFMTYKLDFFDHLNTKLTGVLTDGNTQWLFIVFGVMGSIIALIQRGCGAIAFGKWVSKRAESW